jgi:plastocyanin
MVRPLGRRAALSTFVTGVVGSLAGCSRGPSFPEADVIAGPNGRFVFEPDELTVSIGDSVRWGFASSGHNVSGRPTHSDHVVLPESADPFASCEDGAATLGSHVEQGETYEHAFDVVGMYVYVCVPHVSQGMAGTIRVDPSA